MIRDLRFIIYNPLYSLSAIWSNFQITILNSIKKWTTQSKQTNVNLSTS